MTVLTGEDLANLTGTTPSPQTGNIVIEADTFIGDLQGNATTADKLAKEFTLVVEGDVHGSVTTDGSKDKVLNTTVSHADHSDVSDYTEQSKLSERASLADLANLATYALESAKSRLADLAIESEHATESDHSINADKALQADKASESDHAVRADNATHSDSADKDGQGNVITDTYARDNAVLHFVDYARQVNVTGLAKGEGRVNRTSIDIVISELAKDELQLFVFSPLPAEDADTTKIYVSQEEKQFYLYDTATLTWVNLFDTYNVAIADLENKLNDGLESAQSSIQTLSDKVDTDIQGLSDDVDSRLSALSGELSGNIATVNDKVDSLTETVTDTYATKEYSDGNLDSAKSYTDTKLETYATKEYSDQNLETSKDYTDTQISELDLGGAGLEIGDIGIAPLGIDETDNCRRYLNGQVILQSQFEAFTTKLKSAIALYPNLVTSEDNWQSAVTLSPLGQCGKFVIDDEAGTIRLPKVVNVMGALDLSTIGQTVEAGLPNIEGTANNIYQITPTLSAPNLVGSGAFIQRNNDGDKSLVGMGNATTNPTFPEYGLGFDASLSNPIYGNSETVQQEAIKYPYFIQVATSSNVDVQIDTQVRLNNPFSLFMPYWSPIELNNLSWLRSNKQWNNGSVYISAYEFLLSKYNSGTEQTETISGVSVTYILADNGMKIITDKSKYDELISASGSAWFFVLDTENTQFILPYTNGFAQFGDELGKFTEAGLPNITGELGLVTGGIYVASGAFSYNSKLYSHMSSSVQPNADRGVDFSASNSSSIYGNSSTVQPNSVTGYLYFYVGEVEQDANIIATSGLAESISRKADNDLGNVPNSKGILVESYVNGTSWYRVYSDGWCEQGGQTNGNYVVVNLLKPFINMNYTLETLSLTDSTVTADAWHIGFFCGVKLSNSQIKIGTAGSWFACGYIS